MWATTSSIHGNFRVGWTVDGIRTTACRILRHRPLHFANVPNVVSSFCTLSRLRHVDVRPSFVVCASPLTWNQRDQRLSFHTGRVCLRRGRVDMGSGQSRSHKRTITDVDRAVLALKTQKRKLGEYQKRVEGAIEREEQRAKDLVQCKKNKQALLALKKRKLHQQQLEKVCAWVLKVEESIVHIEQNQVQNDVYANLKRGNEALQILQKEVSLDDVDEILQDSSESAAHWEDINRALSDQLDAKQLGEVDDELKRMEKVMLDEELSALPAAPEAVQESRPREKTPSPVETTKPSADQRKEAVVLPS